MRTTRGRLDAARIAVALAEAEGEPPLIIHEARQAYAAELENARMTERDHRYLMALDAHPVVTAWLEAA